MAGDGPVILFSSHILEEVERLADAVLVVVRRAARGVRRLPLDPPADDRPTAPLHGPLVRRPAAWPRRCWPQPSVFGAELVDGRARRPDRRTTPRSRAPSPRRRAAPASASSRSPRPTTRSRACSATWCADERRSRRSSASRCAGLLGRRRTILLVLLAALPVLDRAAHPGRRWAARRRPRSSTRSWSGRSCRSSRSSSGTAAIGSEIEDGTARLPADQAHRRAGGSPWPRSLVAAGLTAAARRPADRPRPASSWRERAAIRSTTVGRLRVAALVGGIAYAVAFTALGAYHVAGAAHRPRLHAHLGRGPVRAPGGDPLPVDPAGDARRRGRAAGVDLRDRPARSDRRRIVDPRRRARSGAVLLTSQALRRFEIRGGD